MRKYPHNHDVYSNLHLARLVARHLASIVGFASGIIGFANESVNFANVSVDFANESVDFVLMWSVFYFSMFLKLVVSFALTSFLPFPPPIAWPSSKGR